MVALFRRLAEYVDRLAKGIAALQESGYGTQRRIQPVLSGSACWGEADRNAAMR